MSGCVALGCVWHALQLAGNALGAMPGSPLPWLNAAGACNHVHVAALQLVSLTSASRVPPPPLLSCPPAAADVEEPVEKPVVQKAGPVKGGKLINVKQPVGTYTDWVLPCQAGRQRCTNLALASQGFQCMTLDNRACCLNGNGKNCWRLSRAGDGSTPDNWTGRELAGGWVGGWVWAEWVGGWAALLPALHACLLRGWLIRCLGA